MNEETAQLIALAILALTEIYAVRGISFAWFWDLIARICGAVANFFGRIAVEARLYYFEAVEY